MEILLEKLLDAIKDPVLKVNMDSAFVITSWYSTV